MPPIEQQEQRFSVSATADRWRLIVVAAAAPVVVLVILCCFQVPIGQPFFLIYRYSPLILLRIGRALPAMAISLVAVAILYRAVVGQGGPMRARTLGALLICYACLVIWAFVGLPSFIEQHAFNLLSPSQDGAFVREAGKVESIREYVGRDFYERLRNSPEQMLGRRVLSNPPGTTVVAFLARRCVERAPWLRSAMVFMFGLGELDDVQQQAEIASALLLGILLTAAWGVAIFPAYWLARLWLPQAAAICVALGAVFNPAAVTFTPGKDPAQLLTVLLIAAGWLGGYARRRWAYGVLAGLGFVAGTVVGLVHIWVLAFVAGATFVHAMMGRNGLRAWFTYCLLPCVLSACALVVLAALTLDWNVPRTVVAVALRYREIQLPIITDPIYWTLVGLPMFLLFVGPLFWSQVVAFREKVADEAALLGTWLLACAGAVMTYSYFFANNSETPRLWIPFIPPLLLGMALRRPGFREDSAGSRRMMVLLIALQVILTLAFWTMMDVRETEWRLISRRMWD